MERRVEAEDIEMIRLCVCVSGCLRESTADSEMLSVFLTHISNTGSTIKTAR